MKLKTYTEFITEGLRIRDNNVLQAGFDDIINYLRDKKELSADIEKSRSLSKEEDYTYPFSSFIFTKSEDGFALKVLLYEPITDEMDLHGTYAMGGFPRTLNVFVDFDKLYKNNGDEPNERYLQTLRMAMEHESTHYIQDMPKSKRRYLEDSKRNYINMITTENDNVAEFMVLHFLYVMFNDNEFEAFQTAAAYDSGSEVLVPINDSYAVAVTIVDQWAKEHNVHLNWKNETLPSDAWDVVDDYDETKLFGGNKRTPEEIEKVMDFMCDKLAYHYNKTYEGTDKEKEYWARFFVREAYKRYMKFINKFMKNKKKYNPSSDYEINRKNS